MAKLKARGAILAYESATGPSVWSTIPSVGDFDVPAVGQRDEIDITSHDSAGDYEETLLSIIRSQEISVPIKAWDGTNTHHGAMLTRAQDATLTNFKVTYVDTKVHTFSGYIKSVVIQNPVAGALGASLSIKPTGAFTVA